MSRTCRRTDLPDCDDDALGPPGEPSRARWFDSAKRPTTKTTDGPPVGKPRYSSETTDESGRNRLRTPSTNSIDNDARELAKHPIF